MFDDVNKGAKAVREVEAGSTGDAPVITLKALVLGTLSVGVTFLYLIHIGQGYRVGSYVHSLFPMAAFMPFVVWLFLNLFLRIVAPRIALKQGELLTIFCMLWVVGTLPQLGWMTYWTSIMAAPSYFASAENNWTEVFFDVLPWHVFAKTSTRVIDPFWFGLPQGMEIPWEAWYPAIAQWLGVSTAMVMFGYCLFALFHKHWSEAEKLAFPIAQLPLDLTRGFATGERIPPIFRSGRLWIGFFIVFLPILYNIATYFSPGLMPMGIYWEAYRIEFTSDLSLTIRILPLILGLTYLCPVDILGSLVVFHLIGTLKAWTMTRLGVTVGTEGQPMPVFEILHMESYGAMVFVGLWSIWLARSHLGWIGRLVWQGGQDVRQTTIYRAIVVGLVLSAAYIVVWCMGLGMGFPLAAGSLLLMSLTYFVTAKLVAATGFAYLLPNRTYLKGDMFVLDLIGSARLSHRQLIAYKVMTSKAFFGTFRIPAWPAIPHLFRMFSLDKQPVRVTLMVLLAFPTGFLVASTATIQLAYGDGGSVFMGGKANQVFEQMVELTNNPRTSTAGKWLVWGLGWVEAAVLAFARSRLHWFPVHPIGLVFQTTFGTRLYWFSLLLVWIVKLTILRTGGASAFRRGKPLFYGIAIGYVSGIILSVAVDLIWFPTEGHSLHHW